jgi:predicted permease
VFKKRFFTSNKFINGIFITDILNLMLIILKGEINQKLINVIMPIYKKYSDFDPAFEGEPINAAVKSIHYNDISQFKYTSIEQIK